MLGATQVPTALSTLETWDVLGRQADVRELTPVVAASPFELQRDPDEPELEQPTASASNPRPNTTRTTIYFDWVRDDSSPTGTRLERRWEQEPKHDEPGPEHSTASAPSAGSTVEPVAIARPSASRSLARSGATRTYVDPPHVADGNDGIDEEPTLGPPPRHYRLHAERGEYTMTMGNAAGHEGPAPDEPGSEEPTDSAQASVSAAAAGVTVVSSTGISVSRGGVAISSAAPKTYDDPPYRAATDDDVQREPAIGPLHQFIEPDGIPSAEAFGTPTIIQHPPRGQGGPPPQALPPVHPADPNEDPEREHSIASAQCATTRASGGGRVGNLSANLTGSATIGRIFKSAPRPGAACRDPISSTNVNEGSRLGQRCLG